MLTVYSLFYMDQQLSTKVMSWCSSSSVLENTATNNNVRSALWKWSVIISYSYPPPFSRQALHLTLTQTLINSHDSLYSLIVLALKHFEGTLEPDRLISSYLLCKSRCSIRKHIKEMCLPKAPPHNVIKVTSPVMTSLHTLTMAKAELFLFVFPDISDTKCHTAAAAGL